MSDKVSTIFSALADPTRRTILAMLLEDDMAVTDVAAGFDVSLAAVSKHIGVLVRAGLITQERRGRVVWCKLEPDALREASTWMQAFGQFEGVDLDALEALLDNLEDRGAAPSLLDDLLAAERRVWDALKAGDAAADRAELDPDFLGIYADGFAGRDDHAAQLADGPSIAEYDLQDARALALGPGFASLSYRAEFRRVSAPEAEVMFVTSVWRRDGDVWTKVLSQDTPAKARS